MDKKSLKDTRTRENLMKAFAGESMARNRYCIFASKAEEECFMQAAEIFKDTARNEKEHAEVYFKFLDGDDVKINDIAFPSCYGTTLENLLCAAKYEEEEHSTMYPEYGRIAEEEGFKDIAAAFYNIASIEAHHSKRYKKLADMLKKGIMFKNDKKIKWECSHCGFVVEGEEAPQKCPVCNKEQGYFQRDCNCL
ncbi:MAG: rubrerythrin family protein [Candidatus Gastranaerophilales bacterium]|nr:rubrerythrin family protein [Candidatus Gastranaerophilales bacterium]